MVLMEARNNLYTNRHSMDVKWRRFNPFCNDSNTSVPHRFARRE